jgi:hypothetical protein
MSSKKINFNYTNIIYLAIVIIFFVVGFYIYKYASYKREEEKFINFRRAFSGIQSAVSSVKDKVTSVVDKVKDTAETVKDKVKDTAETVKDKVTSVADKVKDKAEDIISGVKDKVGDVITGVKDKAGDVITGVKDTLENIAAKAKEKARNSLLSAIKKSSENVVSRAKDMIENPTTSQAVNNLNSIASGASNLNSIAAAVLSTPLPFNSFGSKISRRMPNVYARPLPPPITEPTTSETDINSDITKFTGKGIVIRYDKGAVNAFIAINGGKVQTGSTITTQNIRLNNNLVTPLSGPSFYTETPKIKAHWLFNLNNLSPNTAYSGSFTLATAKSQRTINLQFNTNTKINWDLSRQYYFRVLRANPAYMDIEEPTKLEGDTVQVPVAPCPLTTLTSYCVVRPNAQATVTVAEQKAWASMNMNDGDFPEIIPMGQNIPSILL